MSDTSTDSSSPVLEGVNPDAIPADPLPPQDTSFSQFDSFFDSFVNPVVPVGPEFIGTTDNDHFVGNDDGNSFELGAGLDESAVGGSRDDYFFFASEHFRNGVQEVKRIVADTQDTFDFDNWTFASILQTDTGVIIELDGDGDLVVISGPLRVEQFFGVESTLRPVGLDSVTLSPGIAYDPEITVSFTPGFTDGTVVLRAEANTADPFDDDDDIREITIRFDDDGDGFLTQRTFNGGSITQILNLPRDEDGNFIPIEVEIEAVSEDRFNPLGQEGFTTVTVSSGDLNLIEHKSSTLIDSDVRSIWDGESVQGFSGSRTFGGDISTGELGADINVVVDPPAINTSLDFLGIPHPSVTADAIFTLEASAEIGAALTADYGVNGGTVQTTAAVRVNSDVLVDNNADSLGFDIRVDLDPAVSKIVTTSPTANFGLSLSELYLEANLTAGAAAYIQAHTGATSHNLLPKIGDSLDLDLNIDAVSILEQALAIAGFPGEQGSNFQVIGGRPTFLDDNVNLVEFDGEFLEILEGVFRTNSLSFSYGNFVEGTFKAPTFTAESNGTVGNRVTASGSSEFLELRFDLDQLVTNYTGVPFGVEQDLGPLTASADFVDFDLVTKVSFATTSTYEATDTTAVLLLEDGTRQEFSTFGRFNFADASALDVNGDGKIAYKVEGNTSGTVTTTASLNLDLFDDLDFLKAKLDFGGWNISAFLDAFGLGIFHRPI